MMNNNWNQNCKQNQGIGKAQSWTKPSGASAKGIRFLALAFTLSFLGANTLSAELRVAHAEAVKNAVKRPNPEYSAMARQMRIQGDVEVEVKIGESGDVADVKVVTGNPMLSAPVVRAIKDWKFTPFTEDGKPAPAVASLKFTFKQ